MARDGSSGGVIRLVTIDKDGVEKGIVTVFVEYFNFVTTCAASNNKVSAYADIFFWKTIQHSMKFH